YPDSAPLHLGMAVAIESEGKFAEAIDHYRQVVRIEPNLPSAAYNLANALRQQGKYDEAAVCYRRALQLQPNNVDYYNNLGATLAMQGKIGDAADCFYQALRIDPNNTQTHYNLAMLLSEQRKYNESIKHYRIVLKHDPNNMQVYFNIGYALESEGKIDEAIACFRDAIRIAPSSPVPLVELAQLLATHPDPNKQDAKQAVEYARHAAELTKYQDAAVLNNLAAAYAANNQFDKAVIAAQNALDIAFAQHKTDLAEYIAEQLKLYKQAKP
ncbi:MAG: tetratricopeptide repeat protein, partial [Sedimentisphaerales bacterium]|nr:tetratricopeptide repeat protein [Sedimentisphaerales bacterium]